MTTNTHAEERKGNTWERTVVTVRSTPRILDVALVAALGRVFQHVLTEPWLQSMKILNVLKHTL